MPTSSEETKIELVVEAIEALTLAQVVAVSPGLHGDGKAIAVKNVTDARDILKRCLREFLKPSLRVIAGNPQIDESIPYGGKGIDGMNLA
jgi:hypothetical protein